MVKSRLKTTIISLSALMLIGVMVNYSLDYVINHKLEDIINYNKPNRVYNYTFSDAHLNILRGDIEIHNVNISPIKKTLDSLALIGKNKHVIINGKLNTIQLKNIDLLKLIFKQEINIDSFIVLKPEINLQLNNRVKDKDKTNFTKDLISNTLHRGEIKTVLIRNASIKWLSTNKDSSEYFSCDSVSILIHNLYTDSLIIKRKDPVEFSEFLFVGSNFNFNAIKDFSLFAKKIEFCYSEQKTILKNILLKNTLNKIDFTKKQTFEKEWYSATIPKVTCYSKNILNWSKGSIINISKISIDSPSLLVYKDKRVSDPPFIEKILPSSAIRHIPFPLLIDTIQIHKGNIKYQEIVETGKEPGEVFFTKLNLKAYKLTNVDSLLKKDDTMHVHVNGLFMNTSRLQVHLKFPLLNKLDPFLASGIVKNMKASALNKTLTNMAFVEFKTGNIDSLSFKFIANNEEANGTLEAHYTSLHLIVLDTTVLFKNHELKAKKALSWIANSLLRKNNIANTKHFVVGSIHIMRPKNKAITNYFWSAIKSGLISTAISPKIYKLVNHPKTRVP